VLQVVVMSRSLHPLHHQNSRRVAAQLEYHQNINSTKYSYIYNQLNTKKSHDNSNCGWLYSFIFNNVVMLLGGSLRELDRYAHQYGIGPSLDQGFFVMYRAFILSFEVVVLILPYFLKFCTYNTFLTAFSYSMAVSMALIG
jgi:hypothetical protein